MYSCLALKTTHWLFFSTWGGSDPGQTQHPIIKVSVGENISQAVVVMVLLRVQLQELLHPDVGKAERVGPVPLIAGGVYLHKEEDDEFRANEWPNLQSTT